LRKHVCREDSQCTCSRGTDCDGTGVDDYEETSFGRRPIKCPTCNGTGWRAGKKRAGRLLEKRSEKANG